jgi:hypothetical protein
LTKSDSVTSLSPGGPSGSPFFFLQTPSPENNLMRFIMSVPNAYFQ